MVQQTDGLGKELRVAGSRLEQAELGPQQGMEAAFRRRRVSLDRRLGDFGPGSRAQKASARRKRFQ